MKSPSRRMHLQWLAAQGLLSSGLFLQEAQGATAQSLRFPRDFGAHPESRTEWWYVTGHAQDQKGRQFGFQLTFFRTRVDVAQSIKSRFAARQLIFAHAAVTDLQGQKLWHDQGIARAGFGLAQAEEEDTNLQLDRWNLKRSGAPQASVYQARLATLNFLLELRFDTTQALLLQGQQGLSRKGPRKQQVSHYYSQPQMDVQGKIGLVGQSFDVHGKAWLDHEWSEDLLDPQTQGWDWLGMNLDDGSALTVFVLRKPDGSALWAGGSFRAKGLAARIFEPAEVRMQPLRRWRSEASGASYPVEWQVDTPLGRFTVQALLDNQELDSRNSTGTIYWEGLSALFNAKNERVGLGYLEMTGYAGPLKLA